MYNEMDNVAPLLSEIQQALNLVTEYEILVIDDGSTDQTQAVLSRLQKDIPHLRALIHTKNLGQSAAILSGVRAAVFPWIITLDGDGQNDPADIPKLLEKLVELQQNPSHLNKVFIAGHRKERNDSFLRKLSSRIANHIRARILKDDCLDTGCSLKLFSREAFLELPHFNHLHRFLPSLFKRNGTTIYNLPVNHRPRLSGQSKYGVKNRLFVGITDLLGVLWLMKRPCNPEIDREL